MKLIHFKNAVIKFLSDNRVNADSSVFSSTIDITARSPVEDQQEVARLAISSKTNRIYLIVGGGKEGAFIRTLRKIFGNELPIPLENVKIPELLAKCQKKSKYDYYDIFIAWFHVWNDIDSFDYVEADPLIDDDYKPGNGLTWLCFSEDRNKKSSKFKSDKLDESDVSEIVDIKNDDDINFKPDIAWIKRMYNEMNRKLFDYRLGHCDFDIFKKGAGSQGHVLGFFTFGRGVKMNRFNRHMFIVEASGNIKYINYENFPLICRPRIELNGNYHGKPSAFLNTLVHEMCHYWTFMNGFSPYDAHGAEFMRAARMVQEKSGGTMEIRKVASAEKMEDYQLDQEIADRNAKRTMARQNNAYLLLVVQNRNTVLMSMLSSREVMAKIIDHYREIKSTNMVLVSRDSKMIQYLFDKGYMKIFRSWRYWDISSRPWLPEFLEMVHQGIKDRKFDVFHYTGNETLEEEEIIDTDDYVEIKPGMNLGLKSPLEK